MTALDGVEEVLALVGVRLGVGAMIIVPNGGMNELFSHFSSGLPNLLADHGSAQPLTKIKFRTPLRPPLKMQRPTMPCMIAVGGITKTNAIFQRATANTDIKKSIPHPRGSATCPRGVCRALNSPREHALIQQHEDRQLHTCGEFVVCGLLSK